MRIKHFVAGTVLSPLLFGWFYFDNIIRAIFIALFVLAVLLVSKYFESDLKAGVISVAIGGYFAQFLYFIVIDKYTVIDFLIIQLIVLSVLIAIVTIKYVLWKYFVVTDNK